MKCKDLEELLSAYADGELPRTQKEFIEEHLNSCAECAATLADFTAAGRMLSSLRAMPETPDTRETTISKIKASVLPGIAWRDWLRPVLAIGAAVIVLAVLLVAQPWDFRTPAASAASIVRNSPEVQAFFDDEQIEEVEVTTKVIGNEGEVLVVLVKTETRAAAAEVDMDKKVVTDIVRVHVPELTAMDEQKAIDIAMTDPRVQEFLAEGGVIGNVSLNHAVSIEEVMGPDGRMVKTGSVEIIGEVPIESGSEKWFVTVDLDENKVLGIAWPSVGLLVADWSELIFSFLNPLMALLGILVIIGLVLKNRLAGAAAGVISIVLGVLSLYGGLYAWPVGLGNKIIALIPPVTGLIIGITDTRKRAKRRWVSVIGMILCALALAWDSFNIFIYPDRQPWVILSNAIMIAGVIAYVSYNKIRKTPWKWLRPALVALAAVIIISVAVFQPWAGPSPDIVLARAHDAASSFDSYHMSISAYTTNPEVKSEQSLDVKFSAPDRYRVISLMSSTELPVDSVEYIIIGEKQWVRKFSDDFDINFNPGTPATEPFLSRETTLQYLDMMTDIDSLPDEAVNGVDCFHYAGIYDIAKSMARMKGIEVEELPPSLRNMYKRIELWIGKDDYLIRKMHEVRQTAGDPEILGTVEMTMDYLSINEPVVIEPPVDADGNVLDGWELAGVIKPGSGRPVFWKNMTVSTGAQEGYNDSIHQEIRYTINLTNETDESVKNVRITIATMLIAGAASPMDFEAVPETPADVMAPGESRTFSASIPFDASGYTKEQIRELRRDVDSITIHFETESGVQMTESFIDAPPYPSAVPPGNPPTESGE